jgi:hypothetical protein
MITGAGISLITAGVVLRFAMTAGFPHGLNVHATGTVLTLAGALGLLLSLLVWGPLNPARRHRDRHRRYDSGTPVLVRAEKRLYQDQDRRPLAGERRVCQDKPPL